MTTPTDTAPPAAAVSPERVRATEILAAATGAARRLERDDLVERLTDASRRLDRPDVTVLVVGEFKQGKSSLVNALVKAPICPVDDDVATAVATVIGYADRSEAAITCETAGDEGGEERHDIRVGDAGAFVLSGEVAGTGQQVHTVEVNIPRKILRAGLRVVDTPGVGGLESAHGRATMGALSMADAVVFVTDSSQELTASELEFLRAAHERCPLLLCAMSKIDIYPRWAKIRDLNLGHLARAGLDIEILPIASPLRVRALETNDAALHDESGYPALVERLETSVLSRGEAIQVSSALGHTVDVVEQLHHTETTSRDALADPTKREELVEAAYAAKERADAMRGAASRWQTVLNDGIGDLNSDVDHDLKTRTRVLIAEVEELIDENDPVEIGDEAFPMIEERLMGDIAENYRLLQSEASDLAARVAELFELDVAEDPSLARMLVAMPSVLDESDGMDIEVDDAPSFKASLLTGVRGGYGGTLMFGMVAPVIGLAALGPVTLAIGGLMGRKAAKDERERQLKIRRQQAKAGVKKHIDQVVFTVNKHSKDTLRQVQRDLRDTNIARAKELSMTATAAMKAAEQAVRTEDSEREARLEALDASIDQLERIRTAADSLRRQVAQVAGGREAVAA